MARKYQLKRRAERQEETRRRIVEAAVELHTTVGPAHTTDAAVAKRANVTRMTFYRHFPSDASLFRACTTHGLRRWPPPDPHSWRRIADPEARLRLALRELYVYYRVAGPGLVAIMRDAPLLRPELLAFPGRMGVLRSMRDVLLEGWKARGRQRRVLAATLAHVTSVSTWQSLVRDHALAENEATELLAAMVLAGASGRASGASTVSKLPKIAAR